jgi:hypothetical protein
MRLRRRLQGVAGQMHRLAPPRKRGVRAVHRERGDITPALRIVLEHARQGLHDGMCALCALRFADRRRGACNAVRLKRRKLSCR